MYTCNICNFETENKHQLGAHKTTKHTIVKQHKKKQFIKNCLKCNKEFSVTRSAKFNFRAPKQELKYCSRLCANSREWTNEQKIKVSESCKNSEKVKKANSIKRIASKVNKSYIIKESICIACGNLFKSEVKFECKAPRKTCSEKCFKKISGGYREGSGRSKHGYYKGIYCGSTYELIWVIYRLDHTLSCERFPTFIEGNGIKYYPDFFDSVTNTIIEIKGYEKNEKVNQKNELAKEKGYNVVVLRKEDLQKEFDWVKNNYNYKDVSELYDNYKPKYSYECSFCKKEFFRNKKATTIKIFCSRSCAGKGKPPLTEETKNKISFALKQKYTSL